MSLADRSGQISLGANISKFSGDMFEKLVATRAANEEALFQGKVNTALSEWDSYLKANPGAGYDELEQERNKLMQRIQKAGGEATTAQARRNNTNWLTVNKPLLYGKTQASMEAISAKQQLATFEENRQNYIRNFERDKLADLTGKMVESGLLDKDFAQARLENDLQGIDAGQQKFEDFRTKELIKGQYQQIIDEGGTKEEAYNIVFAAEDEGLIDPSTKESLANAIDTYYARHIKAAEDQITSEYLNLGNKLASGDATANDILAANIPEKEKKEIWAPIVKGMGDLEPTSTTYNGFNSSRDIVLGNSTGTITDKQAVKELSELRYVDKSISDKEYQDAISRINNKYPSYVSEGLRSVYQQVDEKVRGKFWGKGEKDKALRVNTSLRKWIDDQKEQTGKYPSFFDIQQRSAELDVAIQLPERFLPAWEPIVTPETPPTPSDPLYIRRIDDPRYDAIDSGVLFYDGVNNTWRVKQ